MNALDISFFSVTFGRFSGLPITVNQAKAEGWLLNKTCEGKKLRTGCQSFYIADVFSAKISVKSS